MGFRTQTIVEDCSGIDLPDWFVDKWGDNYNLYQNREGKYVMSISSKYEMKMYDGKDEEIFKDIQKIIKERNLVINIIAVMLHECGGITRVQIEKDKIRLSEPTGWKEVEQVEHNYCYECSDIKTLKDNQK